MRILSTALLVSISALSTTAGAQSIEADVPLRTLDTVVVQATQPGPALWKIRNGDHVLWILGTESILAADTAWKSRQAEQAIQSADEIIGAPGVVVGSELGFFSKLALMPALAHARDLPGGMSLAQAVPAASYARWLPLRTKYLKEPLRAEHWRPVFAALDAYSGAAWHAGLTGGGGVTRELQRLRDARPGTRPVITASDILVPLDRPRARLADYKAARPTDSTCFDNSMTRIEPEIELMLERAAAWAYGDIATLRALDLPVQYERCRREVLGATVGSVEKWDAYKQQSRMKWLENARTALGRSQVSFTTLPFDELVADDGLVSTLAARGYVVEPPTGTRD